MLKILFFFCHFINITKLWFNGALRPLSYNKSTKLSCQCCSLSSIHHSSLCYCEPKFFRIFFVKNAFLEIIIIETFPRKNIQFSVHKPDSRVTNLTLESWLLPLKFSPSGFVVLQFTRTVRQTNYIQLCN